MNTDVELKAADPMALFGAWFEAARIEPNDPNAAALATATRAGRPSVRMVLVKQVDASGFHFFTNTGSQKGSELTENPFAALCFHWKSLRRQVRVQGSVSLVSEEDTAAYFHSRSRASQVGAAVSLQSRPLRSRSVLEEAVQEFAQAHLGEIPLPATWRGYLLRPDHIEFWQDGPDRLHQRIAFEAVPGGWTGTLLYP